MYFFRLTINGGDDVSSSSTSVRVFADENFYFKNWETKRFIEVINSFEFFAIEGKEQHFNNLIKAKEKMIKFFEENPSFYWGSNNRFGGNQYYEIKSFYLPEKWSD